LVSTGTTPVNQINLAFSHTRNVNQQATELLGKMTHFELLS